MSKTAKQATRAHVEEIAQSAIEDAELRREVEHSGGEVPAIYHITQGHRRVEFIWFHALGSVGVGTQTTRFAGHGGVVWIYVAPLSRISEARAALNGLVERVLIKNTAERKAVQSQAPKAAN
jgi:hypothetical protein